MLCYMREDPNTKFFKAVDERGHMVAGAKWIVYNGFVPERPRLVGDYWGTGEEDEYAKAMFDGFIELRTRAVEESKGHLVGELSWLLGLS
jgi:hypothetical protein